MLDEDPPAELIVPRIVLSLPAGSVPDVELSFDDSPVDRELVGDLVIFYAFDQPTCFTMVAYRDIDRLALTERQLHDLALVNLRQTIPQLQLHEVSPGVFMLTCGGDFEATTLLLDEVWEQVAGMICGDLVVAVPSRDVVMFAGSENREGMAFMRSKVSQILEMGDRVLTRSFLVRRESWWDLYEGFSG